MSRALSSHGRALRHASQSLAGCNPAWQQPTAARWACQHPPAAAAARRPARFSSTGAGGGAPGTGGGNRSGGEEEETHCLSLRFCSHSAKETDAFAYHAADADYPMAHGPDHLGLQRRALTTSDVLQHLRSRGPRARAEAGPSGRLPSCCPVHAPPSLCCRPICSCPLLLSPLLLLPPSFTLLPLLLCAFPAACMPLATPMPPVLLPDPRPTRPPVHASNIDYPQA